MSATDRLKTLLSGKKLVTAPGAYDALTAKLIEGANFEAVYMTGFGTAAATRGLPDMGLLTMTEMLNNAAAIADAVSIPLIADADTGYGNPINVVRTVREYEKAGVAAIHIEDQVWPKRCGHMAGKSVIPTEDMTAKIRAATDSRNSSDFLIIARCDAIAIEGWDAALERGNAYVEAGADVIFIEAPETVAQMQQIPKHYSVPCLINMAPRTPSLPARELEEMGYAIAIYPAVCLSAAIRSIMDALRRLKEKGEPENFGNFLSAFLEFNEFLGGSEYDALAEKYRSDVNG
jgi:2-methylisocitrate lyase-like PEP mutase family enzyme